VEIGMVTRVSPFNDRFSVRFGHGYARCFRWDVLLSRASKPLLTQCETIVLRQILKKANEKMETDEQEMFERESMKARVEEAARLEGISFEQAMENRKGFRFLY
jgi:hypothetical protein